MIIVIVEWYIIFRPRRGQKLEKTRMNKYTPLSISITITITIITKNYNNNIMKPINYYNFCHSSVLHI